MLANRGESNSLFGLASCSCVVSQVIGIVHVTDQCPTRSAISGYRRKIAGRTVPVNETIDSDYNDHYNAPMTSKLKITTIGSSVGVVLPKEILAKLRVGKGDTLYAIETPNGIELQPYDPDFAEQLELAKRVMREDRDALRMLAE